MMKNLRLTDTNWILEEKNTKNSVKATYVRDEGPSRGFSFRDWKENLPKNRAIQETEFLGQLLTDMVIMNITILAITNDGINQGIHFLNCLTSQ